MLEIQKDLAVSQKRLEACLWLNIWLTAQSKM